MLSLERQPSGAATQGCRVPLPAHTRTQRQGPGLGHPAGLEESADSERSPVHEGVRPVERSSALGKYSMRLES